ncbi:MULTISPECIES: hypothetical protein [Nostoc]|uniref:Uncharacterized protein n=2 Tax=Nostoc TaxID=1177 RepID=A0ABR8I3W2_9NOSO|nr:MULTISPECIES: hypothetical protein [Nostoc]MBD2561117.1 hypothetical protein [Nostoc linckia FACHB-391]MBD2646070.1 hypothetical protein [Nostoc foliaceum FACHB-393]
MGGYLLANYAVKGCEEMMGWLFGSLVKQFEGAAKEVVRESSKEIADLFDDKLYPLADKLDYIAQESINPNSLNRRCQTKAAKSS